MLLNENTAINSGAEISRLNLFLLSFMNLFRLIRMNDDLNALDGCDNFEIFINVWFSMNDFPTWKNFNKTIETLSKFTSKMVPLKRKSNSRLCRAWNVPVMRYSIKMLNVGD